MDYILNKEKEIINLLIKKIGQTKEILISISYITNEAFNYLREKTNILNKKIKIITTTDDYLTDPKVLDLFLNNKNIEIKIINENENLRSFHTKFIILNYYNGKSETINGSFNLTKKAYFNKYELISVNETKQINIDDFNYLFNKGKILTKEFLSEYKNEYELYIKLFDLFKKDLKNKLNIKPNAMQDKVLKEIDLLRRKNENRALLWSATGTGKTFLSAFDAKRYNFKKLLFIVHNRTIIKSAKKDYGNIFFDKQILELYTNGIKLVNNSDIVFSTEKTIKKILEEDSMFLNNFDYFIFDEAHKIGEKNIDEKNIQSEIFDKIIELKNNYFILGMSATPTRSDNPLYVLNKFKNNIVGKITTEDAIKMNLISTFNYYGREVDVDFDNKKLGNDDIEYMVNKFISELETKNVWREEKIKGIVFTKTTDEADEVARILTSKNYKSEAIHTKNGMTEENISQYIELVQSDKNDINFLVTINKFNEGVDIPRINTIVMFRFTESNIIYTQQIGRGLRKIKENGKEKFLNVFDLVGNHENNFNRIIGLSGKISENPKEILKKTAKKDSSFFGINVFDIDEISREKILNSLNRLSYIKFFKDKINERVNLYNDKLTLNNIEELFEESIQIISNNFRKKRTLKSGDECWISLLLSEVIKKEKYDLNSLSEIEHQLLELFSWMPFTTSTPNEKKQIIKLIQGEKVSLSDKWYSYFIGKNIHTNKQSQIVKGDFSNNFKYSNEDQENFIIFKSNEKHSDLYNFLLKQIKNYLYKYQDRNDKLEFGKWYSKVEIGFIAGHTANMVSGMFKKFKNEKSFEENEIFLTNKIIKKDKLKFNEYQNEIVSRDNFIISYDNDKDKKENIIIHNFLGSKKFYSNTLYKYIGLPLKIEFLDMKETGKTHSREGKKTYKRFNLISKEKLEEMDFLYFKN